MEARDAVTFLFLRVVMRSESSILARFSERCRLREQGTDPEDKSLMGRRNHGILFRSLQSGTGASRSRSAHVAPPMSPLHVPAAPPALLALADGTVFRGTSAGATGLASGAVVCNTAITGYQEILTDPSYCRQIVTLTHPHIGNTGTNREDMESGTVFAAGQGCVGLSPLG